jgi:hypothetical protein
MVLVWWKAMNKDLESLKRGLSLLIAETDPEELQSLPGSAVLELYKTHVDRFNQLLEDGKNLLIKNKQIGRMQPITHLDFSRHVTVGDAELKTRNVHSQAQQLLDVIEIEGESFRNRQVRPPAKPKAPNHTISSLDSIVLICDRFHSVAKQLAQRHEKREPLLITDEYDVQDLLHSILLLFFDDVRREEYTPSSAGGSSRMDILLKSQAAVIEAKYDLTNKQLREQLAVDAAAYKKHPDCKTLICFDYDPQGRIQNPRGFETDLAASSTPDLKVKVLVRP